MPRVFCKTIGSCLKAPVIQKTCALTGLAILLLAALTPLQAATIWDGPLITYAQPGTNPLLPANQDPLTANVVITRALTQGIFNIVNEAAYVQHTSPTDTEWAVGDLSNATNLTYTTWQLVDGIGKPVLNLPGQQLVLHLVTDDIYLSVKFTYLPGGFGTSGLFTYIRSTPLVVNTPPAVSITNPVHNASFASPASFTIEADATDADGLIANVAFFDGAAPLGSVTNPPYEMAVLFTEGLHPLTAVATDDMGASTTSALVNVNVSTSNLPPLVTITSPTNGAFLAAPANVTIFADASDSDGTVSSVQFYDDATLLGTDTDSPYSVTTLLYPGTHPLSAVAVDNSGATSTSTLVSLTVTSEIIPNPIVDLIPAGNIAVDLQTIADGLAAPLDLAAPDDDTGRLFVYDQEGRVWVVTNGVLLATPLLDVRDRLVLLGAYDERGLLGFTVHPNYAFQPFLYTYTSEPIDGPADFPNGLGGGNNHQAVLAEWRISTNNANVVDPTSRREIMRIDQPQSNHNGGAIHFGPDGMLYIALGDGGSANDVAVGHSPGGNGQDINVIHGKMLRIDVNGNTAPNGEYAVPASNPFVGTNGLDEIWAYGLRNPFSFHFERGTTNLYLADVGQRDIEEVDIIVRGGNYGWSVREGTFWFDGAGNVVTEPVRPVPPDLVDPIAIYDHDDGLAIIGGFVYHGTAIPDLQGRYVFGDWGSFSAPSGRLFYLDDTNGVNELRIGLDDRPLGLWLRGFGEGPDGELYVFCSRQLGPSGTTGRMMKLVPAPDPLRITTLAPSNGTHIAVGVSGGAGPFALQERPTLDDPIWRDAALDPTRSVLFPLTDTGGFLRTVDVGHLAPLPLSLVLSGGAQHPANASTAEGCGIFRLDGNTLSFDLRYAGLAAVATAAHIHGPADTSADAPPVVVLNAYNGGTWGTNGTLSGVIVLTDVQKAMMLGGQTYVNIHNPTFPGGEVRGQIVPANMHVALRSAYAVPDSGTGAHGLGNVVLIGDQLTFNLTYMGLSGAAVAAHIHGPASPGSNGGVLVDLSTFNGGSYGADGQISGTATLTPEQAGWVADGLVYINFHTADFPAGEMRGHIVSRPTGVPLTTVLSGAAQHPAVITGAGGSGAFSLEGDELSFNIDYNNLSGAATAAHIHGPAATTGDGGVLVDLTPFNCGAVGTAGMFSGQVVLTAEQRNNVLAGLTYVNVHTAANSGGEIRGQIAPVSMFAALTGNNQRNPTVETPATGSATLALVRDRLNMAVSYADLFSAATAAHIHGPAGFFASGGVLAPLDAFNGGSFGVSGSLSGAVPLVISDLLNLIDGQTYINIHTTNNPSGEIRGQIMR